MASMIQSLSSSVADLAASSTGSSSTGSSDSIYVEGVDINNISIAGHHIPLAAVIATVCLVALFLVCLVVTMVCNGCCSCINKTEETVDTTVQDVKGWAAQRSLDKRKTKVQLLKAKHARSDYSATQV